MLSHHSSVIKSGRHWIRQRVLGGRLEHCHLELAKRCSIRCATVADSSWLTGTYLRSRVRMFHFATQEYAACFNRLPQPDPTWIRQQTIEYLDHVFQAEHWFDEPVRTELVRRISCSAVLPHTPC
jgi:hypothetical protein